MNHFKRPRCETKHSNSSTKMTIGPLPVYTRYPWWPDSLGRRTKQNSLAKGSNSHPPPDSLSSLGMPFLYPPPPHSTSFPPVQKSPHICLNSTHAVAAYLCPGPRLLPASVDLHWRWCKSASWNFQNSPGPKQRTSVGLMGSSDCHGQVSTLSSANEDFVSDDVSMWYVDCVFWEFPLFIDHIYATCWSHLRAPKDKQDSWLSFAEHTSSVIADMLQDEHCRS